MAVIYVGKHFRKRHGVTQAALAQGTGLREATLVDLEAEHSTPHVDTLDKIIRYFRSRGIPCDVGDLLIYWDPYEALKVKQ